MKLKKYLLSKFLQILPLEESFFFQVTFQKKVKLSDELIALNYKKHAPYKNPFLKTVIEEKHLYIWFYEKERNAKLLIPEAYLFFHLFKEKNPNTLFLIELERSQHIIIIQNGILVNSYSLDEVDENLIAMEMSRYALDSVKTINTQAYMQYKEEALSHLNFQDLYKWNGLNIENKANFPMLINAVAYPLSFLLFFIMSLELYHVHSVEKKLAQVEEAYSLIKSKNDDIRERINREDAKEQKWLAFVHRELPYRDSLTVFSNISKAFKDKKFIFKGFSIVGTRVKIDMETKEDFIVGLNILNKIEGLKNVALKYSNKKRHSVSYEVTIVAEGLAL